MTPILASEADPTPSWQIGLLVGYGLLVGVAWARHFAVSRAQRTMAFLEDSPPPPAADAALVSILIPAKDEEAALPECLTSVLAQDYPNIEVFVVDDRSTDRTPAVAAGFAARDPRVRVVTIESLEPGWTGKTNALQTAQRLAKGEWLLFVDADVTLQPSAVSSAVADADRANADLYSMLPRQELRGFWERAVQPFAATCLMFLYPLSRVNDPARPEYAFANGQFLLVRRRAYDAVGGHSAVRDKFVEDIHFARAIRGAGLKLRVVVAREHFRVRMYPNLNQIVRGWSRIFYSAASVQPAKLWTLLAFVLIFSVSSYAVLLGGVGLLLAGKFCWVLATLLGLGVMHEIAQTTVFARIYSLSGVPLRYLWLRPLGVAATVRILIRSLWMMRTGRVEWRGTTYGSELKQAK